VIQEEEDDGILIECPILVLWGEEFAIGGKMWDFRSGKRWPDTPRFSRWLSVVTFGMRKSHKRKTSIAAFSPMRGGESVTVQRKVFRLD
jgi:hypothetical protein